MAEDRDQPCLETAYPLGYPELYIGLKRMLNSIDVITKPIFEHHCIHEKKT